MDYIVHITRGSDNVATEALKANSDAEAFDLAKAWAASLALGVDDAVVLAIKLPTGGFKTFVREDF